MLRARSIRLGPPWIAVLLLIAAALPARAFAQRRTTIGFETDCNGSQIANGPLIGNSYVDKPSNLFAACGVASIETGEVGGGSYQRIVQSGGLLGESISGISGVNAVAGAYNAFAPSELRITFVMPVHEVAFDVLAANSGAQIRVRTFNGSTQVADETQSAPGSGKATYTRASINPITQVVVNVAQPSGGLASVDRWYVDQLSFNSWVCGDGELENQNGGTETCDDSNLAQCDGCSATCTASMNGCWNGTTCVAPGAVSGCTSCDMTKPAGPSGDIPTTVAAVGTVCDDLLKCTQGDACDASGRCAGVARSCDDTVTCTVDACSEAATGDGCTHTLDARSCLIGGSCFNELTVSPNSVCQTCDPTRSTSAWSPVANTVRCAAPTCVGDQFTAAALCDGAGACAPVAPVSCGNFVCATGTSCMDSCSDDRECGTSSYCDPITKKCIDNLPVGASCTANGQCARGLACADGVCCESACGSKCETCNAPGFVGKCINITFGDPENECPDGTSCRSGNQCVQDLQSMEPVPTSDAGVPPPPPTNNGLPLGALCGEGLSCGLGFCVDGVCCATACDGVCEGCNVLGATPGQCVPFSLGSDPQNECAGVAGVCSGANACAYYETRGAGSCAALPGVGGGASWLDALLVACAVLVTRRRRAT